MIDLRDPKLKASCFEAFLTEEQRAELKSEYKEDYREIMIKALGFVRSKRMPAKTREGWTNFILSWYARVEPIKKLFVNEELSRLQRAYKNRYTEEHAKLIETYVKDLTPRELTTLVTETIATQTFAPTPSYFNLEAKQHIKSRDRPSKDFIVADKRSTEYLRREIYPKLGVTNLKDAIKKWRDMS